MILAGVYAGLMLLILLLLQVMNLERERRWQQMAFLWAHAVSSLVCFVCIQRFAAVGLPRWLTMIPPHWSAGLDPAWSEVLASNIACGLVLLVVKFAVRLLIRASRRTRPGPLVRRWYQKDDFGVQPTPPAYALRRWMLLVLWMHILGLCVGIALSFIFPVFFPVSAFQWWPLSLLTAILEVYWFANGRPIEGERSETPPAEERPIRDESDFESTFPEWFVCKNRVFDRDESERPSGKDREARIADCIQQAAAHPHVLIDTILFSDLGKALIEYLDGLMNKGENVLVLALDTQEAEKSADYIRRILAKCRDGQPALIVRSPRNIKLNGDCDLAVLTAQQVLELQLGVHKHPFTQKLNHLVVLDTAQILSWQSDLLATVLRLLMNHCPLQRTIFLSSFIPLQLASVIKGILDVPDEALKIIGGELNERPQTIYLWRKENIVNNKLPLDKLTNVSVQAHDFDLIVPLAVKAYHLDRRPIQVISENFPINQTTQAIRMAGAVFKELVPLDALIEELSKKESCTATVLLEDQDCLLATALSQAQKYTENQGDVHLISRPYMLRDYFTSRFKDNPVSFIRERTYANPLSSSFTDSAYTIAVQVMIEAASKGGIMEMKLRKLVRPYLSTNASLREILCWCGRQVFHREEYNEPENDFGIRENDYFNQEGQFVRAVWIYSQNPAVLDDLQHSRLRRAKLSIPGVAQPVNLRFSADSIPQRLLKHQGLVYDGTIYQVTDIDVDLGLIKAELATEDMRDSLDFVQTRVYDITHSVLRSDSAMIDLVDRLMVQSFVCNQVQVVIPGYYILQQNTRSPQLLKTGSMVYQRLFQPEQRMFQGAHLTLLGLRWPDGSDPAAAAVFLAVLMNELFRTFFPSDWPCIAACPLLPDPVGSGSGLSEVWEKLSRYYPSANITSLPGVSLQSNYAYIIMIEDSSLPDGRLLRALLGSIQRPFEMPLTVLADYLTWLETGPGSAAAYLSFGGESIPPCFDLKHMKEILTGLYGIL